ncbi:NADP-dependent phosphogluconate dehydrogenase [Clostridiales bacterium COT073_COT-073]|nr:NADP-dependent phosphogluconate dehydrogenase [Clostridiales bacterium COT073_COT-073]
MQEIGLIGLSVMGVNLALNMADHGVKVSIFNRTVSVIDEVMEKYDHPNFRATYSIEELVKSLSRPRKIMMMVKAGQPVDMLIEQLLPYLEAGDILIDGGNSFFKDTIRREKYLSEKNIFYLGVGVSGGEEGARRGPAIMPGGNRTAYQAVEQIFENISAKAYDEPCCRYIGEDGSGHYVKMVHNGIEYADMQLISEIYMILKEIGGLSNDELQQVFAGWNQNELESYLIEITADIFKVKDGDGYLVDKILDKASQKGTGKWTNLEAIDLGVDISVITSAVNARYMSNLKSERVKVSEMLDAPAKTLTITKEELVELARHSLYVAKIVCYAQGFKLLDKAQEVYNWTLNFDEIARIFRGGCIIRAKFLNDIAAALTMEKGVQNLIMAHFFRNIINQHLPKLREIMTLAVQSGIAVPAMSAALAYIDTYRTADSGANLIQAQRDYFGAHTFERTDQEGSFHYDWTGINE